MPPESRLVAVALHDVEPATLERCALIRDWLSDHGVDRVTLLVVPAADGHPFFQRSPAMELWLHERRAGGDAVAQHGFVRTDSRNGREFAGLKRAEARERVLAGRRLMAMCGLAPRGFVAPGYSAPAGLGRDLADHFDWWIGNPLRWRARLSGETLRIDLHPADFDRVPDALALERALRRAHGRRAVTYDEISDRDALHQRRAALPAEHRAA